MCAFPPTAIVPFVVSEEREREGARGREINCVSENLKTIESKNYSERKQSINQPTNQQEGHGSAFVESSARNAEHLILEGCD